MEVTNVLIVCGGDDNFKGREKVGCNKYSRHMYSYYFELSTSLHGAFRIPRADGNDLVIDLLKDQ